MSHHDLGTLHAAAAAATPPRPGARRRALALRAPIEVSPPPAGRAARLTRVRRAQRRVRMSAAVRAGARVSEVALRFTVAVGTVRRACREQGVPTKARGSGRPGLRAEAILILARAGSTGPEIAKRLKVSVQTVRRTCAGHRIRCVRAVPPRSLRSRRIALALAKPGPSIHGIGRRFRVSRQWVQQVLARAVREGALTNRTANGPAAENGEHAAATEITPAVW